LTITQKKIFSITSNTGGASFLSLSIKQLNVRYCILKTKNLSREQLLTSFLSRSSDLSSSGLQIDSEGFLYASGEMIAAWRENVLFIDCGSNKVCNRRQVHSLRLMAERENITHVPYNEFCFAPTAEFLWCERMVSYPIWSTPKDVNPKNIFAQAKKILDKAIEKNISYESIQQLLDSVQYIATVFNFTFDTTQHTEQATQGALNARAAKQLLAQHHLEQYQQILQELEANK
jgi:hypothetical protein